MHSLRDSYIKALEIQLKYELLNNNKKIETVFIGGGTPSTIDPIDYKSILHIIKPFLVDNCEITIEANPNSATKQWLEEIYETGINRISFGVQSFDDKKLNFLGRNHNKIQAIDAIKNAFLVGFQDINLDIIYDTALDTQELLDNDLEIIKNLPINHISAYSLTIEEGTKFFSKSNVKVENEELAKYLFKQLSILGFHQYEISNFSKNTNARSKHNLGYWEYKEYLGVGSGAVGCLDNKRYYCTKDVVEYIKNPLKFEEIELLSTEDIKLEKLLLGFRSLVGVSLDIFNQIQYERVLDLVKLKKLKIKQNKVYSTDFLLADELALEFIK